MTINKLTIDDLPTYLWVADKVGELTFYVTTQGLVRAIMYGSLSRREKDENGQLHLVPSLVALMQPGQENLDVSELVYSTLVSYEKRQFEITHDPIFVESDGSKFNDRGRKELKLNNKNHGAELTRKLNELVK